MASESHEAVEEMSDARTCRWSISVEDEKKGLVEVRQTPCADPGHSRTRTYLIPDEQGRYVRMPECFFMVFRVSVRQERHSR